MFFRRKEKSEVELSEQEIAEIKRKNDEMENIRITFTPKLCPKCGSMMSVRKLGVWGYWCNECEFWWGTYDPYPIEKVVNKKRKKDNDS
ncbi:MAG: hypothetical protein QXU20_02780 [Candidatus Woesearchaeota archaeon]